MIAPMCTTCPAIGELVSCVLLDMARDIDTHLEERCASFTNDVLKMPLIVNAATKKKLRADDDYKEKVAVELPSTKRAKSGADHARGSGDIDARSVRDWEASTVSGELAQTAIDVAWLVD